MTDSLFDGTTPPVDPEKDYFSELVGEDKKYKDPRAAGRALVEKDNFIEQLKVENAQMRDEITKRVGMEALVDKITAARTTAPTDSENNQNRNVESPPTREQPAAPAASVETTVDQILTKRFAERTASENRVKVANVLQSQWGPGWAKVLSEKAEALGVGTNFVDDLAGRSPQAVFQLAGVTEAPVTRGATAPALRTNPGPNVGGRKNFAYYDQLRKTDPTKYFSLRNSQEMMAAAVDQGDDFYR